MAYNSQTAISFEFCLKEGIDEFFFLTIWETSRNETTKELTKGKGDKNPI